VFTTASEPASLGNTHGAQRKSQPEKAQSRLLTNVVSEAMSHQLRQEESFIVNSGVRESQAFSRGHNRALMSEEGGLPRHIYRKMN
jgi:hypothetical protein